MSKKDHRPVSVSQANDPRRLVVRGELRKDPDWDAFIAALVAFVLRDSKDDDGSQNESHHV
ncbi:MAG TPA: hypothetical protein VF081_09290 [Solirubrobacterales bacterium]